MMEGRIGRFLRAARTLMWMQVAAGLFALALSIWAVLAVRDLAAERDRLQERLSVLESRPLEGAAPVQAAPAELPAEPGPLPPPPTAPTNEAAPAAAPVEPIPLPPGPVATPAPPPPRNPAPPATGGTPSADPTEAPPPLRPRPRPLDCTGAAATSPRCRTDRPGRWVPPADIQLNPGIREPRIGRDAGGNRQRPVG